MKSKSYLPQSVLLIIVVLFLFMACNPNREKIKTDNYTVIIENLDTTDFKKLIEVDTTNIEFIGKIFNSPVEKNWLRIYRNCMASETSKRLVFLGVSNRLGIGTIYQKRFISTRDEINLDNFTKEEISTLTNPGGSGSCQFEKHVKIKVDFEALMDINPNTISMIDADLGVAMSGEKNMEASIEGWQKHELITGRLIKILERTTKQEQMDYFDWFKEEGNLLVKTVYQINGFSMIIETQNTIEPDLKVKLDEGIIGKLGKTDITVKFKYEGVKKIKMISENEFFVFGEVAKIKKVRKRE